MFIKLEQVIDIYNELIDCKNRENKTTEIYIRNIIPFCDDYEEENTGSIFDEDNRMLEKKAAEDFHSLCHIFSKKHEVSITIDSIDIHEWISKVRTGEIRFFYRVHVEVLKLFPKKDV